MVPGSDPNPVITAHPNKSATVPSTASAIVSDAPVYAN